MRVVDWAGRTRYRDPRMIVSKKQRKRVVRGGPSRYGAQALRIWENLREELKSSCIRKNKEGKDTFPVSTWFVQKRPGLALAISHNGGFPAVVKLLQDEGHLAEDYVPVVNDKLTPSNGPVMSGAAKVPKEWEELVSMMADICRELGRMPKTCSELRKTGHANVATAIGKYFYSLPYVEMRMKKDGLLDFLEKKKEGGEAKEGAGTGQPGP